MTVTRLSFHLREERERHMLAKIAQSILKHGNMSWH